jgi:hypothetical protein
MRTSHLHLRVHFSFQLQPISYILPPFIYARPIFAWLKEQGKHSRH